MNGCPEVNACDYVTVTLEGEVTTSYNTGQRIVIGAGPEAVVINTASHQVLSVVVNPRPMRVGDTLTGYQFGQQDWKRGSILQYVNGEGHDVMMYIGKDIWSDADGDQYSGSRWVEADDRFKVLHLP